jgi:hypothetical protein
VEEGGIATVTPVLTFQLHKLHDYQYHRVIIHGVFSIDCVLVGDPSDMTRLNENGSFGKAVFSRGKGRATGMNALSLKNNQLATELDMTYLESCQVSAYSFPLHFPRDTCSLPYQRY